MHQVRLMFLATLILLAGPMIPQPTEARPCPRGCHITWHCSRCAGHACVIIPGGGVFCGRICLRDNRNAYCLLGDYKWRQCDHRCYGFRCGGLWCYCMVGLCYC